MRPGPLILSLILGLTLALCPLVTQAQPAPGGTPIEEAAATLAPSEVPASPLEVPAAPDDVPRAATTPALEVAPVPAPGSGTAAVAPATPTPVEMAGQISTAIDAVRAGRWLAALSALILLSTGLLRYFGWLDRLPKRSRVVVPLLLGCLTSAVAGAAAGVPWPEAVALALTSGPSAIALHQLLARGALGLESPEARARSGT